MSDSSEVDNDENFQSDIVNLSFSSTFALLVQPKVTHSENIQPSRLFCVLPNEVS